MSTISGDPPPPTYQYPPQFRIGIRPTEPLVSLAAVKGHLALLHAFALLRQEVEALPPTAASPGLIPEDPERRWGWFIAIAVERFERWVMTMERVTPASPLQSLPPTDVIMIWHAYLLNPGWYDEDMIRIDALEGLRRRADVWITSFDQIAAVATAPPSDERLHNWESQTGLRFDPLGRLNPGDGISLIEMKDIHCPICGFLNSLPYMTADGTGYFQSDFKQKCKMGCEITKEQLAFKKLVSDLVRENGTNQCYFAGTIHTPTNPFDTARGKLIKDSILQASVFRRNTGSFSSKLLPGPKWEEIIRERTGARLTSLHVAMASKMRGGGGRLIGRITSAYTNEKIFSVDLVGAAFRQSSFVKKMHDLKWTMSDFFSNAEDEVALQHAIARYHAFLDLMTTSPASFFVPTLDIDLVWHTHQLMAINYQNDCMKFIGRYIDHDDKVEENHLSSAFDLTCRAWQDRFGIRYTHCGCPLPGDTLGQRLSRLTHLTMTARANYLNPPDYPSLLAATHPSDHNSVFAFKHKHRSEAQRRARQNKYKKRAQRDAELAAKGSEKVTDRDIKRSQGHEAPFLVPVPMYYGGYYPAGYYGGCAAGTGSVINCSDSTGGLGGCAAGGGACSGGGSACGSGGGCGGSGGGGGCGGGGGGGGGGGCGGGSGG